MAPVEHFSDHVEGIVVHLELLENRGASIALISAHSLGKRDICQTSTANGPITLVAAIGIRFG